MSLTVRKYVTDGMHIIGRRRRQMYLHASKVLCEATNHHQEHDIVTQVQQQGYHFWHAHWLLELAAVYQPF